MKKLLLLFNLLIGLNSCETKISKDKITIIDKLVLGTTRQELSKQVDSLNIAKESFYTKIFFYQSKEVLDNKNSITYYYTSTFDLPKYRNPPFKHVGLFQALFEPGTNNVVELIIHLGHTAKPYFLGEASSYFFDKLDKNTFSQNVNINLLDDIEKLLSSKYGKSKEVTRNSSNGFYVMKGKEIFVDHEYSSRIGFKHVWETEYLTITFFTGITSAQSIYNKKHRKYIDSETISFSSGNQEEKVQYANPYVDEVTCNTYPYISYKLKPNAIKALKLDEKPI